MVAAPLYQINPQNEEGLVKAAGAFETVRGVAVPPKFLIPQALKVTGTRASQDSMTSTGGYDRRTRFSRRGQEVAATLGGDARIGEVAFEDLPGLNRLIIGGPNQTTPATDGLTPPAYTWPGRPSSSLDDLGSLAVEVGHPDNVKTSSMLMATEETLTIDTDANASWITSMSMVGRSYKDKPRKVGLATAATATTVTDATLTGLNALVVNAWVGGVLQILDGTGEYQESLIISNTATAFTVAPAFIVPPAAGSKYRALPSFTPGIVSLERELINAPGTQLFLDDRSGVQGTSQVLERFISLTITTQLNLATKRFGENVDEVSARVGRGERLVALQLKMEWDRERYTEELTEFQRADSVDESTNWRQLRVQAFGSEISPGVRKLAQVNIPRVHWLSYTPDSRNNNSTGTLAGQAYLDEDEGYILERIVRNGLAAIPA